jgi:hypothetical protein
LENVVPAAADGRAVVGDVDALAVRAHCDRLRGGARGHFERPLGREAPVRGDVELQDPGGADAAKEDAVIDDVDALAFRVHGDVDREVAGVHRGWALGRKRAARVDVELEDGVVAAEDLGVAADHIGALALRAYRHRHRVIDGHRGGALRRELPALADVVLGDVVADFVGDVGALPIG